MNLIKAHGEKGSGPFSFERLATFPPQADHVLVDLFFIHDRPGGCVKAHRQYTYDVEVDTLYIGLKFPYTIVIFKFFSTLMVFWYIIFQSLIQSSASSYPLFISSIVFFSLDTIFFISD